MLPRLLRRFSVLARRDSETVVDTKETHSSDCPVATGQNDFPRDRPRPEGALKRKKEIYEGGVRIFSRSLETLRIYRAAVWSPSARQGPGCCLRSRPDHDA